ncbi:transposable element Tcb2 transposase [Trichonephila clavipes]|nr:transposable element Tcb2 transposase [Trichonephila clavipes]
MISLNQGWADFSRVRGLLLVFARCCGPLSRRALFTSLLKGYYCQNDDKQPKNIPVNKVTKFEDKMDCPKINLKALRGVGKGLFEVIPLESRSVDLKRFLETGSAGRRPGQGRRRATTPNKDRYLVLTARRYRNMNAILLQQHLRSATGTTVSIQTVRNRLHGVGLYARRPMVCVRLTSRHHRDRREWATEHVNWRINEWSNFLFSNESRFSVHPDNRSIFIWRDRGSRNNPAFVHESVRFGGGGVLVYGGISIDGRTDLYIIRDGPLTARRYRDEILRPIVVPYAAAIGDDFILMDYNCRPHRANLVEYFLFEEGIVRME